MLELLNWDLSAITPYCILDQLLRRLAKPLHDLKEDFDLTEVRNYSEAILNLAMTETTFLTTSPCLVAVSSLITAMSNLGSNQQRGQNEAMVANFLHQLFEISNIKVEEISEVISQLEHIVRLRFAYVPTPQPSNPQQQQTSINSPYCNSDSVNMKVKTTACVC